MSLFNQILSAINNPNQQASPNQLVSIFNTVQQLSNNAHTNPSTIQSVLSIVGKYVRPALQQKRATEGNQQTQAFINQYSGTNPSNQAVQLLLSAPQIQQLVQEGAQRTGLDAGTIQSMLPLLVPLVLNVLKTGTSTQNPQDSNSVLNSFLDSDSDGDIDISDAIRLASRFLNQ